MSMRNDLELCCNCKFAEYTDFNDKTVIKCNKRVKQSRNLRDPNYGPIFSCFRSLSAYACNSFVTAKLDSKSNEK